MSASSIANHFPPKRRSPRRPTIGSIQLSELLMGVRGAASPPPSTFMSTHQARAPAYPSRHQVAAHGLQPSFPPVRL